MIFLYKLRYSGAQQKPSVPRIHWTIPGRFHVQLPKHQMRFCNVSLCTAVTEAEPASCSVLYGPCQNTAHTAELLRWAGDSQVSQQDWSMLLVPAAADGTGARSIARQLIPSTSQLWPEHLPHRQASCTWAFQKDIMKVCKTWYLTHLSLSSESFTEQNRKQNETVYYLGSYKRRGSPTAEFRKGLE